MKETWLRWWKGRLCALGNYRYALLVVLLGAVLMVLPGTEEKQKPEDPTTLTAWQEDFDLERFEARLEGVLSSVEGAGETQVLLTLDRGSQQVLAQDMERDSGGGGSTTTVTVGRGSGNQNVVPLQTLAPRFRGALVVCPGGDDPQVKLKLIHAVSALTGLGADRISVCRGSTGKLK